MEGREESQGQCSPMLLKKKERNTRKKGLANQAETVTGEGKSEKNYKN